MLLVYNLFQCRYLWPFSINLSNIASLTSCFISKHLAITLIPLISSQPLHTSLIRPNSMPFQRYCVIRMILWINLWFHRLIPSLFSYILKRVNIFSFTVFLTNLFTSQRSLWCFLSNQGDYSGFYFYQKSLKNPL